MYSAEESSARANYYVPLEEKKCSSVIPARRAVHVLSRRYALTTTGYKYLEIGINVGPPSYVEIVVGDHRGNELALSLETWKGLCEQRWKIQNYFWSRCKDPPINIGPITVRFCKLNDVILVRLESPDVCLTMTESTLFFMFDLDECVDVTFDRLVGIVDKVDAKFAQFSKIALTLPENLSTAIRASDAFDKR